MKQNFYFGYNSNTYKYRNAFIKRLGVFPKSQKNRDRKYKRKMKRYERHNEKCLPVQRRGMKREPKK